MLKNNLYFIVKYFLVLIFNLQDDLQSDKEKIKVLQYLVIYIGVLMWHAKDRRGVLVVRGFCCCCGVGRVCPQLVHYLRQMHSFSLTGVHRTVIVVRLLAGNNLI